MRLAPRLFYVHFVVKFILLFFIVLKVEVQKRAKEIRQRIEHKRGMVLCKRSFKKGGTLLHIAALVLCVSFKSLENYCMLQLF